MKIVWDEPKRLKNLATHGLDFAALDIAFFAEAIVVPAKLGRSMAIGVLEDGRDRHDLLDPGPGRHLRHFDATGESEGKENL
jgi:hypothetical protein